MLRPGPAVPIERPPTVEEVIDELRARLTLVALRAQEDGEVARVHGPSATGLEPPTVLSGRLSHRTAMKEGLLGDRLSVSSRSEHEEARSYVARWFGFESAPA